MSFRDFFKKASKLVLNLQDSEPGSIYEEGDYIFCKNNVCVHPPAVLRQDAEILHHPGYLTISCQNINKLSGTKNLFKTGTENQNDTTLILTWIPNTALRKHPSSVEKYSLFKGSTSNQIDKGSPVQTLNSSEKYSEKTSWRSVQSLESYDSSLSNSSILESKGESVSDNHSQTQQFGFEDKTPVSPTVCDLPFPNELPSLKSDDNCVLQVLISEDKKCEIILKDKVSKNSSNWSTNFPISSQPNVQSCDVSQNESRGNSSHNFVKETFSASPNESFSCDNTHNHNFKSSFEPFNNSTDNINSEINVLWEKNEALGDNIEASFTEPINERPAESVAQSSLNYVSLNCEKLKCTVEKDGSYVVANSEELNGDDVESNITNLEDSTSHLSPSSSCTDQNSELHLETCYTSNHDVEGGRETLKTSLECTDSNNHDSNSLSWVEPSESPNVRRYLFTSNSASPATVKQIQRSCQKFSVDLSEMRSLRLFFSNSDNSSGQLVVASRESQYKILHFHHGGLNKLAEILQDWNKLKQAEPSDKYNPDEVPYRHFMICKPEVDENDLHPEEGSVPQLTESLWFELLNEDGQIEDPLLLKKSIFFNGLPSNLRREVWPFLLQYYSYQSTFGEREAINKIRKLEYEEIVQRRMKLEGTLKENFMRNVQFVVEKDVVRTDRNNPYYAGDKNPNLEVMKNILLNYAIYNSSLGYLQGMSDLLAPLLAEIEDESDTFWCFCGLMQRGLFVCTPTDEDMEKNLRYLRELIRIMVPPFYHHLKKHVDAMELLFCHRWILLCFKREFSESVVFQIWEACWSNYLIDYFHLFVCLAIVAAYAADVIAQDLRTDEMLLYFSSLAMYMNGNLILKKARWLLYKFRQLPSIPCSLAGLCQHCGPGMWDDSPSPSVKCRDNPKYCPDTPCPFRGYYSVDK